MLFFFSNSKMNKLILLRYKLYLVFLYLFKTALINLAKYSTVLLYAFVIRCHGCDVVRLYEA
jgi:hypothetical protein